MYILENVPLNAYSTMKLGGNARYLTDINSSAELIEAANWAKGHNVPVIMVGGGSNIFWRDEGFDGLVLVNKIMKFEIINQGEELAYVIAGAGEDWDSVVSRVVDIGYSGLEQLSLIPGKVGAAPVQNIGAYGKELAESTSTLEVFDNQAGQLMNLRTSECGFGYRTSRFKTTDKGRFFITAVTLTITKTAPQPPFYKDIEAYLAQHPAGTITPKVIRDAVIAVRTAKLPDVNKVANCGSFFHNPIITKEQFDALVANVPELTQANLKWSQRPYWETSDGRMKISAGRMIELAGFDNYHDTETGIGQWPNQNLILVNERASSTADLLRFRQKIIDAVKAKFGIELQQEPELLP